MAAEYHIDDYNAKYVNVIPEIMSRATWDVDLIALLTEFYVESYTAFRDNRRGAMFFLDTIWINITNKLSKYRINFFEIIEEAKKDARKIVWGNSKNGINPKYLGLIRKYEDALGNLPKNIGIKIEPKKILNRKFLIDLLRALHPDKAPDAKRLERESHYKSISSLRNELINAELLTSTVEPSVEPSVEPTMKSNKPTNKFTPNLKKKKPKRPIVFANKKHESLTTVYQYDNNGRLLMLSAPRAPPVKSIFPEYIPTKKVNELFTSLFNLVDAILNPSNHVTMSNKEKNKAGYIQGISISFKDKPIYTYDSLSQQDRIFIVDFLKDIDKISNLPDNILPLKKKVLESLQDNDMYKKDVFALDTYGDDMRRALIDPYIRGGRQRSHTKKRRTYRNKTNKRR